MGDLTRLNLRIKSHQFYTKQLVYGCIFLVHHRKFGIPITATETFCKAHSKTIKYIALAILAAGNVVLSSQFCYYICYKIKKSVTLVIHYSSEPQTLQGFCVCNCRLFGILHCCLLFEFQEGNCFGCPNIFGGVHHCVETAE